MNKKVKNATEIEYDGIKFKSILEKDTYIAFKEAGFNPEYEKHTYVLQKSKLFPTLHFAPYKDRKLHKDVWGLNTYKVVSIKYKPDFTFTLNKLEDNNPYSAFFEIHNKKQLKRAIETINYLKDGETSI